MGCQARSALYTIRIFYFPHERINATYPTTQSKPDGQVLNLINYRHCGVASYPSPPPCGGIDCKQSFPMWRLVLLLPHAVTATAVSDGRSWSSDLRPQLWHCRLSLFGLLELLWLLILLHLVPPASLLLFRRRLLDFNIYFHAVRYR